MLFREKECEGQVFLTGKHLSLQHTHKIMRFEITTNHLETETLLFTFSEIHIQHMTHLLLDCRLCDGTRLVFYLMSKLMITKECMII